MKVVIIASVLLVLGVVSARTEIVISGFGSGEVNPVNVTADLTGIWAGAGALTVNALDLGNVSSFANATNGIYSDLTAPGRTPVHVGLNTVGLMLTGTLLSSPPGINKFSVSLYDTSGSFNELDYTFDWSLFAGGGANGTTVVGTLSGSTGAFNGTVGSWSLNLFDATGVAPNGVSANFTDLGVVTEYPVITSPGGAEATQDQPFSYQIVGSNSPTSYGATGLPAGLSIDAAGGTITGTPTQAGVFPITLSASNVYGTGTSTLALTVALPPLVVTIAPTVPSVTNGSGSAGMFTISLSRALTSDLIVGYTIKGTALNGTDYLTIKSSKKIKAGKMAKNILIIPEGDLEGALSKTVKLLLTPSNTYTVSPAKAVKVVIHSGN